MRIAKVLAVLLSGSVLVACGPSGARAPLSAADIAATLTAIDARPPPTPLPCADSVARVQAYKAAGQNRPLGEVVATNLSRERRPVGAAEWTPSPQTRTDSTRCIVHYDTTIGNERVSYSWMLTLATGRVEANDDATQRLSGW